MISNLVFVIVGGGAGAACRYLLSLVEVEAGGFPAMTFVTNLLGAIFIGILAASSAKHGLSNGTMLLLKTGFCGGFTTFSTFSLESMNLIQQGNTAVGLAYMATSLVLCLAGVAIGQLIGAML